MAQNYQNLQIENLPKGIVQVCLYRPDKLNALSFDLLQELHHFIKAATEDSKIKAILMTGHGKAFSAGADIKPMVDFDSQSGYEFARHGQRVFQALESMTKPVLAAINGYAFGGGCELALAAHMRIASINAQFSQPEVHLGIIPGFGGTQRLARIVGKGRAIDLCITGRKISASEAYHFGLVSEVTDPENLLSQGQMILENILTKSPFAVGKTLQSIHTGFDLDLATALEMEAINFALCCESADKKEGVDAFLNKRQPQFNGE